jgi:hypothetical protein
MFVPAFGRGRPPYPGGRRGAVLLIVILLLGLFAVVGISFVLMAEAEATAARIFREAEAGRYGGALQGQDDDPPEPETIFARVLGDVIYDLPDDERGVFNPLRGHGLARRVYGWNYQARDLVTRFIVRGLFNDTPFNGLGIPRLNAAAANVYGYAIPLTMSEYDLINYSWFDGDITIRDPERTAPRAIPPDASRPNDRFGMINKAGADANTPFTYDRRLRDFYYPCNAPYTYPDRNNVFLGAIRASDGAVIKQSYHLPWVFGRLDVPNGHWTDPIGKRVILRPRQLEHPDFFNTHTLAAAFDPLNPAGPPARYGDVTNFWGGATAANGDSLWMDVDLPVRRWKGKAYKPLVALLIVDLDSHLNVNVAGNRRNTGPGGLHGSNQGWGPWEMNPARILRGGNTDGQYPNLLTDTATTQGRLGSNTAPERIVGYGPASGAGEATSTALPPFYSQVDAAADPRTPVVAGDTLPQAQLPTADPTSTPWAPNGGFDSFPLYPGRYQNGNSNERTGHPLLYNPYLVPRNPTGVNDRAFGLANIRELMTRHDGDPRTVAAELARALSQSTNPTTTKVVAGDAEELRRRRVSRLQLTTLSTDLDRVGLSGYTIDAQDAPGAFQWAAGNVLPTGNSIRTPFVSRTASPPPTYAAPSGPNTPDYLAPPDSYNLTSPRRTDYRQLPNMTKDYYRSLAARLGAVDLNQPLPPYPAPSFPAPNLGATPSVRSSSYDLSVVANRDEYLTAVKARQDFAKEIFQRLLVAAAAEFIPATDPLAVSPPTTTQAPADGTPEYDAIRFLAQVAANIVDYLDPDEFSTPFRWDTGKSDLQAFVFGTELPRVLLNEVYVQIQNDPTDPGLGMMPRTATRPLQVNCWAELYNPLRKADDPAFSADPNAKYTNTNSTPGINDGIVHLQGTAATNPPAPRPVDNYTPPAGYPSNAGYAAYELVVGYHTTAPMAGLFSSRQNVNGDPATEAFTQSKRVDFITMAMGPPAPPAASTTAGSSNGDPKVIQPRNTTDAQGNYREPTMFTAAGAYIGGVGGGNQGFYLVGPAPTLPTDPMGTPDTPPSATFHSSEMQLTVPLPAPGNRTVPVVSVSLVLRKLTNPCLPLDDRITIPNPLTGAGQPANIANPYYNPYITTDYLENITPERGVDVLVAMGMTQTLPDPASEPILLANRASQNKRQPYQNKNLVPANPTTVPAGNVKHTFFRHNGRTESPTPTTFTTTPVPMETLTQPFNWLVHLDRQAISPVELLYVSNFSPHQLTQKFMDPNAHADVRPENQAIGWRTANTRLYRALELLQTSSRIALMGHGGRVPGKVNLNTIWAKPLPASGTWAAIDQDDYRVFQAMADARAVNRFADAALTLPVAATSNDVKKKFSDIISERTPGYLAYPEQVPAANRMSQPAGIPGPNDKPFWGMAAGHSPVGDSQRPDAGISNTLLRVSEPQTPRNPTTAAPAFNNTPASPTTTMGPADTRLFDLNGTNHPYFRDELLRKIFNNVTSRSNTFAIWCTIGYFEVTNEGPYTPQNRPRLGRELFTGTSQGATRNQFFAVIDRTNVAIDASSLQEPLPTVQTPRVEARQGPRPFFLAVDRITSAEVVAANGAVNTVTNPVGLPERTVRFTMTVPATGLTPALPAAAPNDRQQALRGNYDGHSWDLPRRGDLNTQVNALEQEKPGATPILGDVLAIGVGERQELVQVKVVNYPATPTFANPATMTLEFIYPQEPVWSGATGSYLTPAPTPGANDKFPLPSPNFWRTGGIGCTHAHPIGSVVSNAVPLPESYFSRPPKQWGGTPANYDPLLVVNHPVLDRIRQEYLTLFAARGRPAPILGNPGPQAFFDHRVYPYNAVVPYVERLK